MVKSSVSLVTRVEQVRLEEPQKPNEGVLAWGHRTYELAAKQHQAELGELPRVRAGRERTEYLLSKVGKPEQEKEEN
jgi:hypothetical protein